MKEYIVYLPNEHPFVIEEENAVFYGEPIAELIRCKECKYFTSDSIYGVTIPGTEYCIFTMNNRIEENDYCSRAEREEE